MTDSQYICSVIDWVIFALSGIGVLYLFIYSFSSLFKTPSVGHSSDHLKKILVLFPAYGEDNVIVDSVTSFLRQDYPTSSYRVVVISDNMKESTNNSLSSLPITLLLPSFDESSKAKSLRYAIHHTEETDFEVVVVLDADNTVDKDFLYRISAAMNFYSALQVHRTGKNRNTPTAVLDGVSEEINNSIFRKGHVNMGLSSALIGSGMAFDYHWFADNVDHLSTSGEDKELETLLLKQRVHIAYLQDVMLYDEKTQKSSGFYNQRRRWVATQFFSLWRSIKDFFPALFRWNIDYLDKLFQWLLPPRVLQAAFILILSIVLSFIDFSFSIKWWSLLFLILVSLCIAIPKSLWDKKLLTALFHIPLLASMIFVNIFRIRGANKKFIHTEKNYENSH